MKPLLCHYRYGIPYYSWVSVIYQEYTEERLDPEHLFLKGEEKKLELLEHIIKETTEIFHESR